MCAGEVLKQLNYLPRFLSLNIGILCFLSSLGTMPKFYMKFLGKYNTELLTPTLWETLLLPARCSSCLCLDHQKVKSGHSSSLSGHSLPKDHGMHRQNPPHAMLWNFGISPLLHSRDKNTPAGLRMVAITRVFQRLNRKLLLLKDVKSFI